MLLHFSRKMNLYAKHKGYEKSRTLLYLQNNLQISILAAIGLGLIDRNF